VKLDVQFQSRALSASEYTLALHEPEDHVAVLLSKKNLLRLQQDIPLTEAEANAVEDGVNAFEKLLAQLTDVPTPAGPAPRQLQSGLVQIKPTKERRE
jgi:hypothetical protein